MGWTVAHEGELLLIGMDSAHAGGLLLMSSVVEPEPHFLAGAVTKGAARAPALQLKLQL